MSEKPIAVYRPSSGLALSLIGFIICAGFGLRKVILGQQGKDLEHGIAFATVGTLCAIWVLWQIWRRGPRLDLYEDRMVANGRVFPLVAVRSISEERLRYEPDTWVRIEIEGGRRVRLLDQGPAHGFAEALSKQTGIEFRRSSI